MKRKQISLSILLVLGMSLAFIVGIGQAQGPDAPPETREADAAEASVYAVIPIQGYVTDAGGNPLNGDYAITATLYAASSGGEALCFDEDTVTVDNGLFNTGMNFCSSSDIDGKQLYLGIAVEGDPEMTPRQSIYPVPYAWSLKPGAIISATLSSNAILHIENWSASGRGLRAYAMSESGENYGVVGASRSPDGYGGYFYNNGGGVGLFAQTNVATNTAVVGVQSGYALSNLGTWARPAGFFGGDTGVVGLSDNNGTGVLGLTNSADGWAGMFTGSGNGVRISTVAGKVGLEVLGGSKNAVVGVDDGARLLYTEESSEVWFTDYGFGSLEDGLAVINIDPIFAQTVNLQDEAYHVFVQVYGDAQVYVSNRTPAQFEVHLSNGNPNVEFSYRIVAKRLGFEGHRLERAPWADDDPNLYPEKLDAVKQGGK